MTSSTDQIFNQTMTSLPNLTFLSDLQRFQFGVFATDEAGDALSFEHLVLSHLWLAYALPN